MQVRHHCKQLWAGLFSSFSVSPRSEYDLQLQFFCPSKTRRCPTRAVRSCRCESRPSPFLRWWISPHPRIPWPSAEPVFHWRNGPWVDSWSRQNQTKQTSGSERESNPPVFQARCSKHQNQSKNMIFEFPKKQGH